MSKKGKAFEACGDAHAGQTAQTAAREKAVRNVAISYGFEPRADGTGFELTCPNCGAHVRIHRRGGLESGGCLATKEIFAEIQSALRGLPQ